MQHFIGEKCSRMSADFVAEKIVPHEKPLQNQLIPVDRVKS